MAFGNDIGSQTFVAPAMAAIKRAGLTLVSNQTLDLSANTFRTEAASIANAKPSHPHRGAGSDRGLFLTELKQLNGGKMIPVIGTSATISRIGSSRSRRRSGVARWPLTSRRQPRHREQRRRSPRSPPPSTREGQGRQHG